MGKDSIGDFNTWSERGRIVSLALSLTFGADFLLVDGADVDGLRHSLERGGIVSAEEAAVVLLREAPAVEGPGVVAEALKDRSLSARNFHRQSSAVTWCTQMDHFLIIRPKQKLA